MEVFQHKIEGYLHDNPLTPDTKDLIFRVKSAGSLTLMDISNSAAKRGGADIKPESMYHASELLLAEMCYRLCDGFSINMGWFTAYAGVHGTFTSKVDAYDPERHKILFEFHQGYLLRKEMEGIKVDILGMADSGPFIAQVVDVRTGSVNNELTRGRNLIITGTKLKIAGEDASVGIFFTSGVAGVAEVQVPSWDIVRNDPSELTIIIPESLAEEKPYQLKLVSQFSGGGTPLKEPRTTVFASPLIAHSGEG